MVSNTDVVRRFNRFYTERIGVLSDHYLGKHRPLAEARLLFEIGRGGQRVQDLRIRLGLDSGYLARLLRSLERQRLVTLASDPSDRRVRIAKLTRGGIRELRELDERSDAVAQDLLGALTDAEREKLLVAMNDIFRLLQRAEITIEEVDPTSKEARRCLLAYAAELNDRFPEGYEGSNLLGPEEIQASDGVCLVARDDRHAVGCGVVRRLDVGVAEIKHLWIDPEVRGLGLSRLLLEQLEQCALERGLPTVRLDTHAALTEAMSLYRSTGYVEIPPYGANAQAHQWFEKRLEETDQRSSARR